MTALQVDVVRNGFVEGHHDVSLALSDGRTFGPLATAAVFPRSTAKPLQAVGMLRAGLALDSEALALACGSHSGGAVHRAIVTRVLGSVGLTPSALGNAPWMPSGPDELTAWIKAGKGPEAIVQECSGKHAAMLATCVAAGWRTGDYLSVEHPLQRHLAASVADLTGTAVAATGIDGCGSPVFSTTLVGLVQAFLALAAATDGPEAAVAAAIRSHPELVAGEDQPMTPFLRAVPGLVAKVGAEGVLAGALPDGHGFALKVHDGSVRAVWPAAALALQMLDVDAELPVVPPLMGGGRPVGALVAHV